jgi:hypothetical protein
MDTPEPSSSTAENGPPRDKEVILIRWEGIPIEVSYEADWLGCNAKYGHENAHIEIRTPHKELLPVTDTGYRSYFLAAGIVEAFGDLAGFVIHWLDQEAKSTKWKKQQVSGQQLQLF